MKKNVLKYSLLGAVLIFGFLSWFSIYNAPRIVGVNAWTVSILFFSAYIISMCLAAILVHQEIAMEIVVTMSFLFSSFFAFSLWYFIILIVGILLILTALRKIRKDLDLNIKVDLWKSLYTGKFKIVFALAILVSSQYFFIINNPNTQRTIPKLDLSAIEVRIVETIFGIIDPKFKSIQKEDLTVDQFIIQSQQKNTNDDSSGQIFADADKMIDQQIPENLPTGQREALKQQAIKQLSDSKSQLSQKNSELVLQEGRKQLSEMVGRNIDGNEKMANVFVGFMDEKINTLFQPKIKGDSQSSFYSYVIAVILFLTIWPLGSIIMSPLWIAVVILIFKIFIYFGLVEIKTMTVQREIIA